MKFLKSPAFWVILISWILLFFALRSDAKDFTIQGNCTIDSNGLISGNLHIVGSLTVDGEIIGIGNFLNNSIDTFLTLYGTNLYLSNFYVNTIKGWGSDVVLEDTLYVIDKPIIFTSGNGDTTFLQLGRSSIGTPAMADTNYFWGTSYKSDSSIVAINADTAVVAGEAHNADSLGHRVSTGYLKNVMDTTSGIFIGGPGSSWTFDSGSIWSRINGILFSKYNGEELSFLDSSASYSRTSIQRGKVLLKDNYGNKTIGMVTTGIGITNVAEDSSYSGMDTLGIYFSRYADQQIYSQFGLNNLTMKDTTGGGGAEIAIMDKDSIWLRETFGFSPMFHNWTFLDSLYFTNGSIDMNGGNIYDIDRLTVDTTVSGINIFLRVDANAINGDTANIDSLDVRQATFDTSYSYRLNGKILKIDSTATIKGGLNLGGGWTAGIDTGYFYNMNHVIPHGNVIIYDDVTLIGDTLSNNQSYLGLSDVTDSSMIQIRPYSLRSFKSLTTLSRDTDSTYWGIYKHGYNLLKYSTQDTTLKLRDGYVYAKDSIFTSAIKSKSGTDSTLITDGTIVVTDSIIGNGASVMTGFDKIYSDSVYVGDNLIWDNGTYLVTNYLSGNTIQFSYIVSASTVPLRLNYNGGTNPLIRWACLNNDNTADSSAFEDSLPDITGKFGRINIKRQTTLTKPLINNNMFILSEGRFKDDTVFMLADTFTTFSNGMQFIDTTGDDSLYTRVRNTWIKQ